MNEWKELDLDEDVDEWEADFTSKGIKFRYRKLQPKEPTQSEIAQEYIDCILSKHGYGDYHAIELLHALKDAVIHLLEAEIKENK